MSLKNQSADSLTLASNSNDTTGPSDVSNDESVFAAGETSSRLLADIQRAAPAIAARAVEIEAARRVPLDLVETLRSIGVFRMLAVPIVKLNPGILVMQSAQDWATKNVPGAIDGARDRRIFLQG